ncbi:hypothetical protein PF006_g23023 [Phytophthora fragariae]|uniref:Uncharacterized protein n=1 Tax=Phytophthora fragariae TaxID=53985 RepID=A0A6A3RT80_9STRA|nr:hypothetical protein PF009_g24472 [Phytophthora fragariae]KAE9099917.1 hypothetical protein PF006_g23023 [Phytophthora fragariae]
MATEWGFLEPWPRNRDRATTQRFSLRVLIDKSRYQDASLLRQLREGIELFTLLAVVNNGAFVQLMMKSTGIREAVSDDALYYPYWDLRLVGTLSPNDPAATHTPLTWGALLGHPDDPPEYSPEFRAAANKLEAMNANQLHFGLFIYWTCNFQDNRVEGRQELDDFRNGTSSVLNAFQKLLGLRVPAIAQLSITREKAFLVGCAKVRIRGDKDIKFDYIVGIPGGDRSIGSSTNAKTNVKSGL